MTIYFAGPLFTLAEKKFNAELVEKIEQLNPDIHIILPQRFPEDYDQSKETSRDGFFEFLFAKCIEGIDAADAVVAITDGADSDSGTCVEIGYAFAKNIPIIGVRTDFRVSEDKGMNLMITRACQQLILDFENDTDVLAKKIVEVLKNVSDVTRK